MTLPQNSAPSSCLSYDPAVVKISSTLIRQTFPGPPNYERVSKGDSAETYWLIQLRRPVCVNEDKSEPDLGPAQKDIRKIQLVIEPAIYKGDKDLIVKQVIATGKLPRASSGHYHTPVLMAVNALSK